MSWLTEGLREIESRRLPPVEGLEILREAFETSPKDSDLRKVTVLVNQGVPPIIAAGVTYHGLVNYDAWVNAQWRKWRDNVRDLEVPDDCPEQSRPVLAELILRARARAEKYFAS